MTLNTRCVRSFTFHLSLFSSWTRQWYQKLTTILTEISGKVHQAKVAQVLESRHVVSTHNTPVVPGVLCPRSRKAVLPAVRLALRDAAQVQRSFGCVGGGGGWMRRTSDRRCASPCESHCTFACTCHATACLKHIVLVPCMTNRNALI